ncbi:organic solute transporter Ostalpha-domain-containing protein [Aspergillus pseudonomiae]|uniref:Organic solute transporter Ostalpha-domain-containing protein n=1 Tax=Aspergillus pseudonomiae TaxID=1506151 RepID=A0A5N7DQT0_9EURO|nr:organic solute transporter Ostalpha-domain-containing protein [Aspergillus pseudonomiae]KAE8408389.1 organic solute transporter Ostalpha-domain-containing protein [Aspergillus pseudonomiae]
MGILNPRAGSSGCPIPDHLEQSGGGPFVGKLIFYQFNMIVSGCCTAIVLILILGLMGRHAMRMSNPNEQLKIMRICNLIPSYQVLSFISICFPNSYIYLQGFTEVLQGVALYAFLMLLCDFMAPNDKSKVEFFSSLETKRQWQPKKKRDGLAFLSLTWYSVLQYPIITWVAAVSQVVTQSLHIYCLDSTAPHFAHVWLQVITSLSTSIAINAILQFYMNMKGYMTEHRPLLKLMAFKLIVGVVLLEKILFLILTGTKVLKPTASMTYIDVMMGLPTMVICVQMVPLSFLVLYAYRTKPYEISTSVRALRPQEYQAIESDGNEETLLSGSRKRYQGGPWGLYAWAVYLNPLELLRDVRSAYVMIHSARAVQKARVKEQAQEDEMAGYETRYDSGEAGMRTLA